MTERYEIRVHGVFGPVLRIVFADLPGRVLGRESVIRGRMTEAELELLLSRLARSGLEVVRLTRVGG
jgi:hypothetical protein